MLLNWIRIDITSRRERRQPELNSDRERETGEREAGERDRETGERGRREREKEGRNKRVLRSLLVMLRN